MQPDILSINNLTGMRLEEIHHYMKQLEIEYNPMFMGPKPPNQPEADDFFEDEYGEEEYEDGELEADDFKEWMEEQSEQQLLNDADEF